MPSPSSGQAIIRAAFGQPRFEVAVAGNAQEGFILNEASTWQQSGEDLVEVRSNLVRTPVEGGEAALTYAAPDGRPISTAALNSNVRLHLSAAACNTTPGADSVRIRIATDPEADLETAVATETGPNTGLFTTALIPIQRVLPVVQGDSVGSGDRNTKVSASATCGGQTVSAILTVNPGGFVFHSASNVAIPGATVILYDASGAEIERIVSDADGFYVVSAAQTRARTGSKCCRPKAFHSLPIARCSPLWAATWREAALLVKCPSVSAAQAGPTATNRSASASPTTPGL
ncbi:hypothetical protein T190_01690 [Sinorhizobium meliloti CCBAU 01290]|nr:hypothetical protein T190_01690 [Sinorhizobium meliloti CCBAU 01290]